MILRVATTLGTLAASYLVLVRAFDVPPAGWAMAMVAPIFVRLVDRRTPPRGEGEYRPGIQ